MTQDITNFKKWLLAARPKTLPAAAAPVITGGAVAFCDGSVSSLIFIAALAGAFLLQIAVNLANDYFDYKHDIDTDERLGPIRVTQSGLIRPGTVRNAMLLVLSIALTIGLWLITIGGLPILIIVIASLVCTLCYSGGPYPIASNGLGELFVFIFFGPVAVCGTYYLLSGTLTPNTVIASVPIGFLITAIMIVNNLRDIVTDAKAGKRTLAVMLGTPGTKTLYFFLVLTSYLIPALMFALGTYDFSILLPIVSMPLSIPLLQSISEQKGRLLNKTLAGTARLSLVYSILFSLGFLL
ncbi:MAG: 1,4-dihydroxy-2-naphthoate octaprenyltransferase [Desulfobacterales bacterium]|nr:MAG: 1,4-dihydroxy-2-naphthoate octaprenyltransferase [Desulfobacterales bacterium]